ncbi:MAG: hypothetical protein OEW56_08350, partial [Gemmatimonadota bacterium]|nr:hypothetical protein [Gemmatimonadota bacterium]
LLPSAVPAQDRPPVSVRPECWTPHSGASCVWVWISETQGTLGVYKRRDGVAQTNPGMRYDLGLLRNLGTTHGVGGSLVVRWAITREIIDVGVSARYRYWIGDDMMLDVIGTIAPIMPVTPSPPKTGLPLALEEVFTYKFIGIGVGLEYWTETTTWNPWQCTDRICPPDETHRIVSPFAAVKLGSTLGTAAALLTAIGAGIGALVLLATFAS